LRNQRGVDQEFSYIAVIAVVLQMVSIVLLLGALWVGRGADGNFDRWIFAAIWLQLATITAVLARK
jgi:hypothetical protein